MFYFAGMEITLCECPGFVNRKRIAAAGFRMKFLQGLMERARLRILMPVMKVFIVGGTGFLGYHAAVEFLRRGHEVSTISLQDINLGAWFPNQVDTAYGDIFAMDEAGLTALFEGFDAMVYAVGPDDRVVPRAPAYPFFHDRLVEACGRVAAGARKAGVKRCAVLNSYFAHFHRLHPEWSLAAHHPYIRARVEQADRVTVEGGKTMAVAILELPYIFGVMPERIPLWKEALLDRIFAMNPVLYTKGGTNMITVEAVAQAITGAIETGAAGNLLIGDENMSWDKMLGLMLEAAGMRRKVITVPTFLVSLYGAMLMREERKQGKESGLNLARMFKDIQARELYYDPGDVAKQLGYTRGGVEEAIRKTIKACYPAAADGR
jgi:dihydroflavonol-4-reductase